LLLSSFFLSPRLPLSSVLPYTTLFRSFSFRVPRQGKGSLKPERKPPPCRPAPRRPLSNPPDEAAGVQLDIASSSSQGFRPSDGSKARCPACRPLRNGLSVRTAAYAAVRNDGAGFTGPRRPIFPKLAGPASGERRHPEPAPPVKGGHRKGGDRRKPPVQPGHSDSLPHSARAFGEGPGADGAGPNRKRRWKPPTGDSPDRDASNSPKGPAGIVR